MSGKVPQAAANKAAQEVDSTVSAIKQKAEKWSAKFTQLDDKDEDEFCDMWVDRFEKLQKINRTCDEKLGKDCCGRKKAEEELVHVIAETLDPKHVAAGKDSEAPTLSATAGEANGKRAGAKAGATEAGALSSATLASVDADGAETSTKATKEEVAALEVKKKKKKRAKKLKEPMKEMWKKTTLSSMAVSAAPETVSKEEMMDSMKRIVESDGKIVKSNKQLWFNNWGTTVRNRPIVTFEPESRTGVQNIVMWARKYGKRVRASGYRHTWSDMYGETDHVLISMIPVATATNHMVLKLDDITWNEDDLEGIKIVKVSEDKKTAYCKIGASTTNEQFRRWCLRKGEGPDNGNWKWTIPLNVIMVEITFGGSNAPICHGAGLQQQTLSDLVSEIEFVNPKGIIQRVSDPDLLKAAAGAFGLMGIVTAVTLKLDAMTYAKMRPTKTPVYQSVPPPDGFQIPSELKPSKALKPAKIAEHVEAFERHCKEDYYAEWFWFPFQQNTWNNCWQTTTDGSRAAPISKLTGLTESMLSILGQAFNETLGRFSGKAQTKLLGSSAMLTLPDVKDVQVVPLIEALHFRRGIQNMRVVDLELEIPIPAKEDGTADWSICRRAWWDIIQLVYKHEKNGKYPLRVALEMRVMGGSGMLMAPQYGNELGTCSIEVLTTEQTPPKEWEAFMQEVADIWHDYKDAKGQPLNVRSHWAKQWESLTYGPEKIPILDHYKQVSYKDRIPEFLVRLSEVAKAGGYKLGDMKERFSTPLLDRIFFS